MKKIFILIFIIINLYGNTIETAKELFDNKQDYRSAIEIFLKVSNDEESQYYLGKAYLFGLGVEKDLKKAFEYAQKSAAKNNSSGLNLMGVIYQKGFGIERDELQALMYFNQAANLNNIKAMKNIADMYVNHNSEFIKRDLNKALKWLIKAHSLGDENAAFFIGITYEELKDIKNAIKYYKIIINDNKSILGGNASLSLANIYQDKEEYKKAFKFLKKAVSLGNKDAVETIIYSMGNHISEKELLYWMKKGVSLKLEYAYLPLYMYYSEKKDLINLKNFLEKAYYEDENIEMGCLLSSYYLNTMNHYSIETNHEKTYTISKSIIKNNPENKQIYFCYQNLASLYEKGFYVAKNLNQAINIRKKSHKVSVDFAAREDIKYIQKKELELRKNNINQKNDIDKQHSIFPLIDNFSKKEQVLSALETNEYYLLLTNDKSVKIYDKKNFKLLKELRTWINNGVSGTLLNMAYDETKKLLYVSSLTSSSDYSKNDIIHVFDIDSLKVVKIIKNDKAIKNTYLNISEDGKFLVAINNNELVNIINTENNDLQHFNFLNIEKFSIAKIKKTKDDYLVYLLSNNNDLYTLSINKSRQIKKESFNNQISFKKIFSNVYKHKLNDINKFFKIDPIKIEDFNVFSDEIQLEFNRLSKKVFKFKDLNFYDLDTFNDYKNYKEHSNFIFKEKNDSQIIEISNKKSGKKKEYLFGSSFKILKTIELDNKYLLLITSDVSSMFIVDEDINTIANLQGFSSIQKNVAYSNGLLVSSGNDNTLNIFDLKKLDDFKFNEKNYDIEMVEGFGKFFKKSGKEVIDDIESNNIDPLMAKKIYKLNFLPTEDQIRSFFKFYMLKKELIFPTASLFVKNEKDWIMYTQEGLFTYGGEGHKLLKYHQNQGFYKEAKIIENEKLFDKFYRPDLIKKLLKREITNSNIDVISVIRNINPPILKILSNKMINEKDIDLTYQICDTGSGISNSKLIINGNAINPPESRGFSVKKVEKNENKCKVYKSIHTLDSGKNNIFIKSYDKGKNISSKSKTLEITANYKINEKTNLYFLSIAVSDYEDDSLDLKYPVYDVNSIRKQLLEKGKFVFNKVYNYELHNKEVTKDKIRKTVNDISKKIKLNDTFILYIAGHGISEDGLYHFLPYRKKEKISINDIKDNISNIRVNKSLIFLDTCESGAAIENEIDEKATLNRLSYDDNRNFIVASSKNQIALEGYQNHGVFTYSVLEGFKKAYFEGEDELFVHNLASFVKRIVPKLTKKEFQYEQKPQFYKANDFIIGNK